MIRINLLPYFEAGKRDTTRRQVVLFLIAVIIVGTGLYMYNSRLNKQITALNDQIEYTQKEIVKYERIAKKVEEIKKTLALLKKKLEIIRALDANRPEPFRLMDALTNLVIEKKMWLTRLEAKDQKTKSASSGKKKKKKGRQKKGKEDTKKEINPDEIIVEIPPVDIQIEGIALDNKTVADFMTQLDDSSMFLDGSVRLITLNKMQFKQGKESEPINLKSFQIACTKKPPPKPEDESSKDKKSQKEKSAADDTRVSKK